MSPQVAPTARSRRCSESWLPRHLYRDVAAGGTRARDPEETSIAPQRPLWLTALIAIRINSGKRIAPQGSQSGGIPAWPFRSTTRQSPTTYRFFGSVGGFLDKGLTHLRDKGVDPAEIVRRDWHRTCCHSVSRSSSVAHHSLGAIEGVKKGLFQPPPYRPPLDYRGLQKARRRYARDFAKADAGRGQRARRQRRAVPDSRLQDSVHGGRTSLCRSRCRTSISTQRRLTTSCARKACRSASATTWAS